MSPASAGEAAAHLLLGPEEGEKSAFIEKLKETLTARRGEPPEVTRFYGGESRAADVVLCLRNKTLFSRSQDGHLLGRRTAQAGGGSPGHPGIPLLPVRGRHACARDGRVRSEVDRRIVSAIPKERQKIFWEMFDNQKQGWIVSYFRQKKITIDPTAVDYILDMVENNTRDMRTECERLALFFGQGAAIGLPDVEHYIYHSKEENVFTLFDRMCERELAGAEEVLDKILLSREAEATQIISGLLMQFRRLAR